MLDGLGWLAGLSYTGPTPEVGLLSVFVGLPVTGLVCGLSSGLITVVEGLKVVAGLVGLEFVGPSLSGLSTDGCGVFALQISRPFSLMAWSFGVLFNGLYWTKKRTAMAGPGLIFISVFSILKSTLSVVETSPTQFCEQ